MAKLRTRKVSATVGGVKGPEVNVELEPLGHGQRFRMIALGVFTLIFIASLVQPRIIDSSGMLLSALGLLALAAQPAGGALWPVVVSLMTVGVGFALFAAPNMSSIMGSVPPKMLASAGSLASSVRVIGQMFSMALVTLVMALVMGRVPIEPASYTALGRAISVSFVVAAGLCLIAMALSLARGNMQR